MLVKLTIISLKLFVKRSSLVSTKCNSTKDLAQFVMRHTHEETNEILKIDKFLIKFKKGQFKTILIKL